MCQQTARPQLFFSVEFWITGHYDPGRLHMKIAKIPDLSFHVPIPLFVALCGHSLAINAIDGWTDRRHVFSWSDTFYAMQQLALA